MNIKNFDLYKRIIITIILVFLYIVGTNMIVPGVNAKNSTQILSKAKAFNLLSIMSGGSFKSVSFFALGLSPYISAQLIVQILQSEISPKLTRWAKEGDVGRKKITKFTKKLTLIIAIIESLTLTYSVSMVSTAQIVQNNSFLSHLNVSFIITIGSFVTLYISDLITEKGIGTGTNILILVGIASSLLPQIQLMKSNVYIFIAMIIVILLIGVYVYSTYRKFNVHYARKNNVDPKIVNMANLPFKIHITTITPIIFSSSLLGFINLISSRFLSSNVGLFMNKLSDMHSMQSLVLLFFLILFFGMSYVKINLRAKQRSDDLEKNSAYIIGVYPGIDTIEFIDTVQVRLVMFSTIYLWLIFMIPFIFDAVFHFGENFQFSGTGVLIIISTYVELSKKITNKLKVIQYKQFERLGRNG